MAGLDVEHLRTQFPAYDDPELARWVFLENAGGSYPCRQVVDLLGDFYARTKVQVGHPFPASQEAQRRMHAGPQRLAGWLGVHTDELHVSASTSQHTYVLANAFRRILPADAVIVTTQQDHEANRGVWARLAEEGFEVREWPVDPATGHLDPADLDPLLDERVAVVAFPHVSNLVGERNDVAAICARVHAVGAVAVVDGVAAAPHGLPWLPDLGADVYLFSTYKTFGPHQGVMVVGRRLLERLPNEGHHFNAAQPTKRLVPAGPDHAQVAALAGVVEYLELVDAHHHGPDGAGPAERTRRVARLLHEHEAAVVAPLLTYLDARRDVRLLGAADPQVHSPTVAVELAQPGRRAAAALAEHRIAAAGGHFYAWRLCEALGIDQDHGVLRLSAVHTTTHDDVARTIDALESVL